MSTCSFIGHPPSETMARSPVVSVKSIETDPWTSGVVNHSTPPRHTVPSQVGKVAQYRSHGSKEPSLTSSQNDRRQCCVSFNSNVRVRFTLHLNDYSDKEIGACWFSLQDLNRRLKEVQDANSHGEANDCSGLNSGCRILSSCEENPERSCNAYCTKKATQERQKIRAEARRAVLCIQRKHQYGHEEYCSFAIAEVYMSFAFPARVAAHSAGLYCELDVAALTI